MPPSPPAKAPLVMLLSLWCHAGQPWRARIVDGNARMRDFDSPFELARHLCSLAAQARPDSDPPAATGLR